MRRILERFLDRSKKGNMLIAFTLTLMFVLAPSLGSAAEEKADTQGLTGTISGQAPLTLAPAAKSAESLGIVAFFNTANGPPPSPGRDHRVPDHIALIGNDARFQAEGTAGRYYIGIIDRRNTRIPGPPRPDEKTLVAFDKEGAPQIFEVKAGEKTDTGLLAGKVPNGPFPDDSHAYFTVTGVVKNEDGSPVTEAVIVAFKIGGDQKRRPDFTLQNSDQNGRYSMRLAAGSAYSILIRNSFGGGQPAPGEFVGRYGGETATPVSGQAGQVVQNIDITTFKIPEPGIDKNSFRNKPAGALPTIAPRGRNLP